MSYYSVSFTGWLISFRNILASPTNSFSYDINNMIWLYYSYKFLNLKNTKIDSLYLFLGALSIHYPKRSIYTLILCIILGVNIHNIYKNIGYICI